MLSPAEITGVDFATVFVREYPAAVGFYGETLGLEHSVDYGKIPGGEFRAGNLTLQVVEAGAVGQEFQPSTHPIAFHVGDVEATRSELEEKGVQFMADTVDSGVCHMALFRDPDGNAMLIHNRYAPRD